MRHMCAYIHTHTTNKLINIRHLYFLLTISDYLLLVTVLALFTILESRSPAYGVDQKKFLWFKDMCDSETVHAVLRIQISGKQPGLLVIRLIFPREN